MKFIDNRNSTLYFEIIGNLNNCNELLIAVAFVRNSGVNMLINLFYTALKNGSKISLILSNNFAISEITAVKRLLDIGVNIKIYNGPNSFHLKTYIFKNSNANDIIIGSSNISSSALKNGIEWNVLLKSDDVFYQTIINQIIEEYFFYGTVSFH